MMKKFLEFNNSDLKPIKSLIPKKNLNKKVFEDGIFNPIIIEKLTKIANDFWESLETDVKYKDIIVTGSLMNYNWSEYSDWDLHILVDFEDFRIEEEFVKKYLDNAKSLWNIQHNIFVSGYEVELYCQDINEEHRSSGQFSLLDNDWVVEPKPFSVKFDEDAVLKKSKSIMSMIDAIIEKDYDDYTILSNDIKVMFNKIKKLRKDGLEADGEISVGNSIFKLLRRNGYLGKMINFRKEAYEKQF